MLAVSSNTTTPQLIKRVLVPLPAALKFSLFMTLDDPSARPSSLVRVYVVWYMYTWGWVGGDIDVSDLRGT